MVYWSKKGVVSLRGDEQVALLAFDSWQDKQRSRHKSASFRVYVKQHWRDRKVYGMEWYRSWVNILKRIRAFMHRYHIRFIITDDIKAWKKIDP